LIKPKRVLGYLLMDFHQWVSYKFEISFWLVNSLIGAIAYAYLGTNVALQRQEYIAQYGSFLSFLLVGMSFNYLIYASLDAPREAINPWNLEWNLTLPTSLYEVILGSVCFRYVLGIFEFTLYLSIASAFGVTYAIDIASTILAIVLGAAVMWGFGMISAGIQIITKRWDPVTWFFTMLGGLLSGVWFPYQLLPPSLQALSKFMPQTYILEMLRRAMLKSEPIPSLWESLYPLLITAIIILSVGALVYSRSIKYAKEHGTVGEF